MNNKRGKGKKEENRKNITQKGNLERLYTNIKK